MKYTGGTNDIIINRCQWRLFFQNVHLQMCFKLKQQSGIIPKMKLSPGFEFEILLNHDLS